MEQISVVGIDLGKSAFHVYAADAMGRTLLERRFTRQGLRAWLVRLRPCLIGMETCAGAHHWGRWLAGQGHQVRLMNPRYVKAYVKTNKNDARDAEAIAEAVARPQMRFSPLKTVAQQELLMQHRVRSRVIAARTALANQIRGFLLEFGIVVPQGIRVLRRRLPEILEDATHECGPAARTLLAELRSLPGIGPLTATALVATVGDIRAFTSGRHLAAWLGLVPRQHTTGGQPRLLGISKRGHRYLRTLLIHGARAALRGARSRDDRCGRWALAIEQRRGRNIAIVALANKMARMVWAMWSAEHDYSPA